VSVCRPSQAGIASNQLDKSSSVLARRLLSTLPTLCCKEIEVSPKIRVLPSGTLFQSPDLEKFASAYRSCYRLSSTRWTPSTDKLDRRRSIKLTISPSSGSRPLVYHSNHQALSAARMRRAGLLATADSLLVFLYCVHLLLADCCIYILQERQISSGWWSWRRLPGLFLVVMWRIVDKRERGLASCTLDPAHCSLCKLAQSTVMIDCFNIRYRHKAAALQLPLAADHGPAANRDGIGTDLRTICHLTTAIFLSISSLHSSLQHKISSPEK